MSYDLNGNLATRTDGSGTTTYTWNLRNQLTGLSGPGLTASFGYDGLGRRWTQTVNGARTDFLYDELNPVQEGLLPGTPAATLLTALGLDEVFRRTDGAGPRDFLPDALGSTLALTDSTGTVTTEYTYEPFGGTTATGASSTNPYQFTGLEHDATGLYYYRARYYHPGLQRFISEDPIEFLGGDPNLYAYVAADPINWVDPWGLWRLGGGPGATVGGAAGAVIGSRVGQRVGEVIGVPIGITVGGSLGLPAGPLGSFGGGIVGGLVVDQAGRIVGGIVGGLAGGVLGGLLGRPCGPYELNWGENPARRIPGGPARGPTCMWGRKC